MKTKTFLTLIISLTIILLMGFFVFNKYLKLTINELEKRVLSEIDSVSSLIKIPKPVLESGCEFDVATQTDAFLLGKKKFSNYTWDQDSKTAIITLTSGEKIKVKRGGCDRFDFYITLYIENSNLTEKNKSEIIQKAMKIAEELFEIDDYQLFSHALSTGTFQHSSYKNEFLIDIDSETHCAAQIYFINKKGKAEIKIGYSLCKKRNPQ